MKLLQILKASILAALFAAVAAAGAAEPGGEPADWRVEFEAVCSQTDSSMTLTSEELAQLVARCDRLIEQIGAEAEVVRRVYLKRLKNCRELFAYVLASRTAEPAGGQVAAPPSAAAPVAAPGEAPAEATPGAASPPAETPAGAAPVDVAPVEAAPPR
jgi:hypothetical protein